MSARFHSSKHFGCSGRVSRRQGVEVVSEDGRIYPHQELASHVLGFVGVDNTGLNGIEYTFNSELSPTAWKCSLEGTTENQVILTLDLNIQQIIEPMALRAYEDSRVDSVIAGEILRHCAVFALQVVAATTVLTNEGVLLQPLFVKKVVSPDGKLIEEYSHKPVRWVLSPELTRQVLRSNDAICLTARRRADFPQPDHIQTSAGGVNQGKTPTQE